MQLGVGADRGAKACNDGWALRRRPVPGAGARSPPNDTFAPKIMSLAQRIKRTLAWTCTDPQDLDYIPARGVHPRMAMLVTLCASPT